jgi:hypothetical protein
VSVIFGIFRAELDQYGSDTWHCMEVTCGSMECDMWQGDMWSMDADMVG